MTPIEVSLKVCALGDQIMKDIEGMEERERKLYRELLDASVVYVFSRPVALLQRYTPYQAHDFCTECGPVTQNIGTGFRLDE